LLRCHERLCAIDGASLQAHRLEAEWEVMRQRADNTDIPGGSQLAQLDHRQAIRALIRVLTGTQHPRSDPLTCMLKRDLVFARRRQREVDDPDVLVTRGFFRVT
jgi:hypothetical protein